MNVTNLMNSLWLNGPPLNDCTETAECTEYPLIDVESDKEVRPVPTITVNKVSMFESLSNVSDKFGRFSSWRKLVRWVAYWQHIKENFKSSGQCRKWHVCDYYKNVESLNKAETSIIRLVQHQNYSTEIGLLQEGKNIITTSPIVALSPYLDSKGVLRVGGRLKNLQSDATITETHPIILPKNHHVTKLVVRYHHEEIVHHQGRHFTEGSIRCAGFWIVGVKQLVSSMIHKCVTCRRLRGKTCVQLMSDLPADRLKPSPPFTYVGVDVFGPWYINATRTRAASVKNKRWAVLFSCLVVRAIHIEVIEEMSSASFINALRRFIAIRGPVSLIRSDRGSNFIGAVNELGLNSHFDENGPVDRYLVQNKCMWLFNPPHASHMGGSWERMIGVARRILDSMLLNHPPGRLTHEVLTTLMAEVCAIINARPMVPVSTDPENPRILSPSMLLTQKSVNVDNAFPDLDIKDAYKSGWKCAQVLAEQFWKRWRKEYVQSLQYRRKWNQDLPNIEVGEVVLLKEKEVPRNNWPLALIIRTFPGDDGKVRKVEIRVIRDGVPTLYTRPVTQIVPLVK